MLRSWLVVGLELESDQTGRQRVEHVFFLGAPQDGDGTSAAVRINAATREAATLAEVWGDDPHRLLARSGAHSRSHQSTELATLTTKSLLISPSAGKSA